MESASPSGGALFCAFRPRRWQRRAGAHILLLNAVLREGGTSMNGKRCKQCLSLLLMGMLALLLLSGCGTAEKDSGGDPAKLSSFEAEVIRLVNEERAAYGLPALTTTDALTAAAARRAEEIAADYGHDRPDGSSCFTVLPEIRYETAGENIAAGQRTPAQVVRAWMHSEGHRNNILNQDFTQIGVDRKSV